MATLIKAWDTLQTYAWANGSLARTFTMPTSGNNRIVYIELGMRRSGSVGGNITISIFNTSGGYPTGGALASGTLVANSVGTGSSFWGASISAIDLVHGARYAIVKQDATSSASNNIAWTHTSVASDGDGTGFYNTSGSWVDWGRDFSYRLYADPSATLATVSTGAITAITETSLTASGDVTNEGGATVTNKGFAYSNTNSVPTIGDHTVYVGTGAGAYSIAIGGLSGGTTWYTRAYAINSQGVAYGLVVSAVTLSNPPDVTTNSMSSVGATDAIGSGNVTSEHGATVTEKGHVYSLSPAPTTSDSKAIASTTGLGAYTSNLIGLTPNTTYYTRAYAINSEGTSYGSEVSFATPDTTIRWAQQFTATTTGNISNIGLLLRLKTGTTATPLVQIYSDSADSPDTVLETLPNVAITNTAYQTKVYSSSLDVTSGTKYWIVLEGIIDPNNYELNWGADSGQPYGLVKYTLASSSGVWTNYTATTVFGVDIQPAIVMDYNVEIKYKPRYT